MTAVLTGRGASGSGRSMTARPVAGETSGAGSAAEVWPPADWFRAPARPALDQHRQFGDPDARGWADPAAPSRVVRAGRAARIGLAQVTWPWWLLWPWALGWVAFQAGMAGQSWHFFAQGGQLLFASAPGAGLQLYAAHPDLQIGPLTLALSAVLRALGPGNGQATAIAAMSLTGPLMLAAVWRLVPASERRGSRLLFAGLLFLPVWTELTTHFAHLDDLLALGFSVAALHAVARRHPVWAGLALAAAVDCKPWAAAFVMLLLALPRRQWLTALAAFTGGVTLVWLPFLLADPRTLAVVHFTIPNDRSSALRVLGVMSSRTPWWDRSAQLLLGVAAGAVAVWRRRWPAVLLVAVAARILLDPGVYAYYTSGALLGTIVVDLVVTRWRLPWATVTAALLLYAARFTHALIPFSLHQLGILRLVFAIGVPLVVLGAPGWWVARRPGRHARDRVADHTTAPHTTAHHSTGPRTTGPRTTGPRTTGPRTTAPQSRHSTGPHSTVRSTPRPTSGRGELHVGQRGPRPGMFSQ